MMFFDFVWYRPETWLSGTANGVMGAILSGIRTICFWLVSIIYDLMVNIYNLFEKLCNARILSNDLLREMSNRIGLLLGIVMFFYIIFSLVQMLIDPDKMSNKENGAASILKKAILVVVMLGVSNWAFEALYQVQYKIIDSDAISKLILPYTVKDGDKDKFGNLLSRILLESFYSLDENTVTSDPEADDKRLICGLYKDAFLKDVYDRNKYDQGFMCLNESVKVTRNSGGQSRTDEVFVINFNGILAVAVGAFVVYMLLMYCFKVGVRMLQLAFLEIISPMAIISYMSPKKDNMFGKWWKLYFATYIDVFIRIAIINFVIFLICTISPYNNPNADFIFWDSLGYVGDGEKVFFLVVIILSLLTFAKKAPDLLKELLPAGASKLGFGLGMKDIVGLEKGTKIGAGILGGAAAGAAIGLLGGGLGGLAGGLLKGGFSGLKGQGLAKTASSAWKNQQASNKRIHDWRAAGGGPLPFGRWGAAFNQWLGADTAADVFDREKADLETENSAYKAFDGYIDAAEKRAESQILKGKFSSNSHAAEALKQKNLAEIYRQQSATIKRSDYQDDNSYNSALADLADKASKAETTYLTELKAAKGDYISAVLDGSESDAPTLQNLQQAAGVVDANRGNNYTGFSGITGATLLAGTYDTFDGVNSRSKGAQARNNNRIATNTQEGKKARANAKYSGRK